MSETVAVSAIKNGTVIDHITAGQAFRIIHLLSLENSKNKVTIGLYLPSKSMGQKDLIKIENRVLTATEANEVVVFAPLATINVIQDFTVTKKIMTHVPVSIKKVFRCPNPVCVTRMENIDSYFHISKEHQQMQLTCFYCEKVYERDQLKVEI